MSVSSLKSPCGLYVCSWKLIVVASSRISCTPSWSGEFQFLLCPSSLVAVRVSFPDSSRFPDDEKFVRVVFLSQAGLTQYARFSVSFCPIHADFFVMLTLRIKCLWPFMMLTMRGLLSDWLGIKQYAVLPSHSVLSMQTSS
jgi:hypothetical protein